MIKESLPINTQYVLTVDRIVQTDEDAAYVQKIVDNAPLDELTGKQKNPFAAYGKPEKGDVLYKDLNNDGLINDDDRTTIGNGPNPDFTYGLNLTAAYKGISDKSGYCRRKMDRRPYRRNLPPFVTLLQFS